MKLDISQTIDESCALDEEGNIHREGGQSMDVSKRWVSPTELGRYKTEKERSQIPKKHIRIVRYSKFVLKKPATYRFEPRERHQSPHTDIG